MLFSAKHRRPEAEAPWLDAELEQLEAELGNRLVQQAEELSQRFPPDPQRVLSHLGLALARQGLPPRRRWSRWPWAAAACLLVVVAAASWLLVPSVRETHSPIAQRGTQPVLSSAASTESDPLPENLAVTQSAASEVSEEEPPPAWLLSSEELEGIADLEQPGFALGI